VIRVNSQSGKGGVAYIMKFEHGLDLPRRLQIEFSAVIQRIVERTGTEITAGEIWSTFAETYLASVRPLALAAAPLVTDEDGHTVVEASLHLEGRPCDVRGRGPDVATAFADALAGHCGLSIEVVDLHAHTMGDGPGADTVVYVETRAGAGQSPGRVRWGVGRGEDHASASLRAVISAVNRS
jgi:2-isopropylmalate synthase